MLQVIYNIMLLLVLVLLCENLYPELTNAYSWVIIVFAVFAIIAGWHEHD